MFERILLAIDDTTSGEVGISFATAMAHKFGASVHVFHANEYVVGGRGVTMETGAEASRLVERSVAQLRADGVDATGELVLANCFTLGTRIAEAAGRAGADAILLGSRRHRKFTRLLGRGIRERVIRSTPLPVLAAPSPLKVTGHRRGAEAEVRRLARIDNPTLSA